MPGCPAISIIWRIPIGLPWMRSLPWMGLAVIAAESKFPEHWGFDVSAIEKALAHNERHDTRIRGASTLSQQTAKTCFMGWPQLAA